eukprot:1961028-Prymnesium_polylepis.2
MHDVFDEARCVVARMLVSVASVCSPPFRFCGERCSGHIGSYTKGLFSIQNSTLIFSGTRL